MAVSDYLQLAMPAINFGKGILGIGENALITDAMREQLVQRAKETELNKGSLVMKLLVYLHFLKVIALLVDYLI